MCPCLNCQPLTRTERVQLAFAYAYGRIRGLVTRPSQDLPDVDLSANWR